MHNKKIEYVCTAKQLIDKYLFYKDLLNSFNFEQDIDREQKINQMYLYDICKFKYKDLDELMDNTTFKLIDENERKIFGNEEITFKEIIENWGKLSYKARKHIEKCEYIITPDLVDLLFIKKDLYEYDKKDMYMYELSKPEFKYVELDDKIEIILE